MMMAAANATSLVTDHLAGLSLGASSGTGYVFDERMCGHECPDSKHPEQPARITFIHQSLERAGYLARFERLPIRSATEEELLSVHARQHCQVMAGMGTMSQGDLSALAKTYDSIYFNTKSLESSLLSAGGTLELVEAIAKGRVLNGIANVRPPGHHAEHNAAMGFCTYNNVAVAAAAARAKWGVGKIAIIDWDVHWGNGTYNTFAEDPNILYVSTHRYDNAFFYPCDAKAAPETVGEGEGKGFSVHVGWNTSGIGDGGYLAAFETVIMPICREFNPDMVIVSCGFDAARGDPLGGCDVTPAGYAHMTHMLTSLAGGRIAIVLEGGYNLSAISNSMASCASVLLGELPPSKAAAEPGNAATAAIMATVEAQKSYWKCLKDVTRVKAFEGYKRPDDVTPNTSPTKAPATPSSSACSSSSTTSSPAMSSIGAGSSSSSASSASAPGGSWGNSNEDEDTNSATGFAVEPLLWCPHVDTIAVENRASEIDIHLSCELCGDTSENWVCLHCIMVGCSRFVREHMVMHHDTNKSHAMALSFSDLSVWCYECEAYVHHARLAPFKQAVYRQKFW